MRQRREFSSKNGLEAGVFEEILAFGRKWVQPFTRSLFLPV
jgi:hypothetical protein